MPLRHCTVISLLLVLSAQATSEDTRTISADLAVLHGKVWTVNQRQPEAQAIAVLHGRILAVGTHREIQSLIGPETKVIDAHGRRVTPGFYDSHVHLLGAGQRLAQVVLKDAADEAEFGRRLRDIDQKLPRDRWLLGGDWDHDRTFAGVLPTASLLDRYVSDRPAFLRRYDGHMALANTRALKLAGIDAKTPDPNGGVIVRLPGGQQPSGILRDNAMELVYRLIPPMSDDEIAESVQRALSHLAANGVTSVQDMDGSPRPARVQLFRHYQDLARKGKLTCRIGLRWPLADWRELANVGVETGFGNDWIKIAGVKGFMDGSLGSNTAKMFEPYLNEKTTGVFVTPPGTMRELILGADRAGISVAVHAIGDRANADLLDIFEAIEKENGPRDRRFRIEHAQHLRPRDYQRFAERGVVASMQPYHVIDDGRWAEERIGALRCSQSYAYRSLLDSHACLAFGSDWSVAPVSPILGIDAAVNRRPLDGKHPEGWYPAQRITVAEAIAAYATGSARAAFEEKDRGSLEPGRLADLIILSRDILADSERDHITECQVLTTIVGGRIVYSRPD
jgi:predicted amidohydrolase YtcJ